MHVKPLKNACQAVDVVLIESSSNCNYCYCWCYFMGITCKLGQVKSFYFCRKQVLYLYNDWGGLHFFFHSKIY